MLTEVALNRAQVRRWLLVAPPPPTQMHSKRTRRHDQCATLG